MYVRHVLKFAMHFNNLYGEVGNPLFESDGVVFQRAVMPSDLTGYLPDDLVVPIRGAILSDSDRLEARDVRSALWLCAGDIRKAAERLGVTALAIARIRPEFAMDSRGTARGSRTHSRPG